MMTLVFKRGWWQLLLLNDDALYRRYRRLIVKPSLRKDTAQKIFTRPYLFCVALAALSFACSLYLIQGTGAPWWVSLIGMAEGCLLILFVPRWPQLFMSRGPWNKRLLNGLLFYMTMIGFPRLLAVWLIPREQYPFGFTAGFLLAFFSSWFLLMPLVLLDCGRENPKPPA